MREHKAIILFLLLAAITLLATVGSYGVIETSDARYAEIAREMFRSNDWLNPNLLDVHHYHKPPVTYQITALGYEIWGINPFGARFFLQISILIQIVLVYLLTLQFMNDRKTALWASVIYFTFPIVLIASRNLTTDAFLATFTLLAVYAWVHFRQKGKMRWLYLFTLALGLGFLTKGPVVFLAPVIFAILYNRIEKNKQQWNIHHFIAWGLFLAIASSWFIYLAADNPAFWDYFIGKQTVDRFSHNVFNRSEPFWYFIVLAPLLGMPWLFLFPWFFKKSNITFKPLGIESVLILSVAIPLIFFSISTSKRVLYILPLYPFLAVATAIFLQKLPEANSKTVLHTIGGYAFLLFTALALAPWIPGKIHFPPFLTPVSIVLILLLLWIWKNTFLNIKNKSILISFITASYFLLAATALFSQSVHSFKIATPVTDWIIAQHLDKREILIYNKRLPSVAFTLNKSIISLYDGARQLNREVQFEKDEKWKDYLYNLQDTKERTRLEKKITEQPSLLILYKDKLPKKQAWLKAYYQHEKHLGKWTVYY